VPEGINDMGEEMRGNRGGSGELKRRKGSWMGISVRRGTETLISPMRFRGRRTMKRGEKK
jgi:hypothetical protein